MQALLQFAIQREFLYTLFLVKIGNVPVTQLLLPFIIGVVIGCIYTITLTPAHGQSIPVSHQAVLAAATFSPIDSPAASLLPNNRVSQKPPAQTSPTSSGLLFASPDASLALLIATATPSPSLPPTTTPTPTPTNTPTPTITPSLPDVSADIIAVRVTPTPTPTVLADLASTTTVPANPGGLNPDVLFSLVQNHRTNMGLPAFQKDDRLCSLAASRAPEINTEIANGTMHAGLKGRNLPYWETENIISMNSEQAAFNWWINDPIHRQAIEGKYTYSCIACSGNACAEEFSNFVAK